LRGKEALREIKGKRVTVVGMARSGTGAANLLTELGADVVITDLKREDELVNFIQELNPAVRTVLGKHPDDIFVGADMLILSPGVPSDLPQVARAREMGIPVLGELELAYQLAVHGSADPYFPPLVREGQGGFLAVTGTNGKSTTTALLDWMTRESGFRTILGGNIGNALTREIQERMSDGQPVDYIVAEISSFQLETIRDFRPRGAAVINITPDHLDRYHAMSAYTEAKARIFENQGEGDFLILNYDDPVTMHLYHEQLTGKSRSAPDVHFFSRKETVDGLYARDGIVFCNFQHGGLSARNGKLIPAEEIRIQGVHNLENAMAASAMALLAGSSVKAVQTSLREFPGLEHRLEFVRELNGVRYFNDSKGTNVGAVVKSLESFRTPIVLIAGGRDKAGDFSELRELVRTRVKALVLIGEAAEKMRRALGDFTDTVIAEDLEHAVGLSRSKAVPGDTILLSPACASFDMFAHFEDRGNQFKKIVMELE
jgi:UDP-N-acetylmuramoylalanine--D-glutamate ligase